MWPTERFTELISKQSEQLFLVNWPKLTIALLEHIVGWKNKLVKQKK